MFAKKSWSSAIFVAFYGLAAGRGTVAYAEALPEQHAGQSAVTQVAERLNRVLREEIPYSGLIKSPPGTIDDQRFLRRVTLDVIGRLPTPEEVTAFALDPEADKRSQVVTKLLANKAYGRSWGRYWRDVIMYRKTEERQQFLVGVPLESYMADALNENKPWSDIATAFITAQGPANSNGACGLIVAQQGQPEEIVGEVSRIFLGIQIQCAQCHDHPTDRWKREQFHQLAAFFPRVASQPSRPAQLQQMLPEITVTATDRRPLFGFRGPMNMRIRGTLEHYMSDLQDPQSEGTLMQPVLFATGDELPVGSTDAERRGSLARWITKPDNPYFAQAFVNRLWSELTGEGFYEPVDDIGPDRAATAPRTLDLLARDFTESGYDIQRLFRVIMATELYQSTSAPRREPADSPMQHNVAQRLRGDQIYDNLLIVFEATEPTVPFPAGPIARYARGPRQQFAAAFGYDPSVRRDEVQTTIPQALALMNAPQVASAFRASGNTMLARKLAEIKDDGSLVHELYLRVLGREPSAGELATCLTFINETNSRTEAFEDLLWSLVNSAEFLHRT